MCGDGHLSFTIDVVQLVNGSFSYILRPTKCPEDPGPIIAGVFLSLIFLAAFLLNLMVVVTVATSYTLKRHLYCHLIINFCVACLVDCFFNLSVAIGYVTTPPWRFGYGLSYFNAFTMNMMNSEVAFAVLLLAWDRLAMVKKLSFYQSAGKKYLGIIIVATWVIAFLLAIPLAFGLILSMPYRSRYSCSASDPYDDYYLIAHMILVVIVPTVVMLVLIIVTWHTFHRERKKQKKIKGSQTMGYFDQILMTPFFRNELYPAVFVGCAVVGYVLFFLPFTALTTISPMTSQHWANETESNEDQGTYNKFIPSARTSANDVRITRAMLDESELRELNATTNSTGVGTPNITMQEGLIPEIVDSPAFDTVAVWFRFMYHIIVPVLVFIILRDVRAKCEGLIMCCRPNSVDVASPKPSRPLHFDQLNSGGSLNSGSDSQKSGKLIAGSKKNKNSSKNTINYKTPILFSTSDGLHIRTVEDTYQDLVENKPLLFGLGKSSGNNPNEEPKFHYSLCDLMIGYEDLTDFDGQYHIDDNYDFERGYGDGGEANEAANQVVMGANRAAIGQKTSPAEPNEDLEVEEGSLKVDYRPPTPPKVQVMGNESAVNAGDSIDMDEAERQAQKRGKKIVRFATMLNQEIPRPDSAESSVLNSSANSSRSSDSGIMADTERNSANEQKEERQQFSVNHLYKQPLRKPQQQQKNNRNAKPVSKQLKPKPNSKLREARRVPGAPRKPLKVSSKKTVVSSKVRNIKSRHLNSLDSSLTSLNYPHSSSPHRRFSKPSG